MNGDSSFKCFSYRLLCWIGGSRCTFSSDQGLAGRVIDAVLGTTRQTITVLELMKEDPQGRSVGTNSEEKQS